jgi:hypothetical protein
MEAPEVSIASTIRDDVVLGFTKSGWEDPTEAKG